MLAAVLAGAVVAVPLSGDAASGPYARARLSCPRTADAGQAVVVSGSRFPAERPVTLTFDGAGTVGSTATNATGSFTTTAAIPADTTAGKHTLTATATLADGASVADSCSVRVAA